MNTVIVSGYLQSDVKLQKSQAGKDWASFIIFNRTGYGNFENKNYFNCVCFGVTAQNLSKYKKKGDFVYVIGEVNIKEYEKDGVKQKMIQITANNVDFPPAVKVEASQIERTYDQSIYEQLPFTSEQVSKEAGFDGTFNPKQVATHEQKPYKGNAPFGDFKSDFGLTSDDLPFDDNPFK